MDQNDQLSRPIPHSEEAERAILGAILVDNDLIEQALEKLVPRDFYNPLLRTVYASMAKLRRDGQSIDAITVQTTGKNIEGYAREDLTVSEILNLSIGMPPLFNIEDWVKTVKDKSLSRSIIRNSNALMNSVLEQDQPVEDYLVLGQETFFQLAQGVTESGFKQAIEIVTTSNTRIALIAETGNPITGLATGFNDIDAKTLGFQDDELIILAARPSMGKTALALGIAQNSSIRNGKHVAVFSLEMGEQSLSERIICSEASVDSLRYRSGYLTDEQWAKINEATVNLANSRLFLDETPGIDLARMNMRARRLVAQHGKLDLIVVDYLQLMGGHEGSGSREQEVSKYSRGLKAMAKTFHCPVLALSQLSRAPEKRANPHPILSDLRESGSIEQDADVVIFIYREAADEEGSIASSHADIIIAKQRNGPTGTIPLYFHSSTTKFSNMTTEF